MNIYLTIIITIVSIVVIICSIILHLKTKKINDKLNVGYNVIPGCISYEQIKDSSAIIINGSVYLINRIDKGDFCIKRNINEDDEYKLIGVFENEQLLFEKNRKEVLVVNSLKGFVKKPFYSYTHF